MDEMDSVVDTDENVRQDWGFMEAREDSDQVGYEPGVVYEALGRAVAESHALEVALVRLYAISQVTQIWPERLHRLLAEREKWRISSSLEKVVLDLHLELPDAQRLALALQYRRYLMNDFPFEFEILGFDPAIHRAAIQRLNAIEAVMSEQVLLLNDIFIERQVMRQDHGLPIRVAEAYDYYRGARDCFSDH